MGISNCHSANKGGFIYCTFIMCDFFFYRGKRQHYLALADTHQRKGKGHDCFLNSRSLSTVSLPVQTFSSHQSLAQKDDSIEQLYVVPTFSVNDFIHLYISCHT